MTTSPLDASTPARGAPFAYVLDLYGPRGSVVAREWGNDVSALVRYARRMIAEHSAATFTLRNRIV
jgi:methyl coenzyme M reductase subunit C-like uncharacterized protein (methanogenesis marker protein 7)